MYTIVMKLKKRQPVQTAPNAELPADEAEPEPEPEQLPSGHNKRDRMVNVSIYAMILKNVTHCVQALIRVVMRRLMNITEREDVPPTPLGNGKFWTADDPLDENRYLRPD